MKRITTIFAALSIFGAGLPVTAATATAPPDVAFSQQDGDTVQAPANGVLPICIKLSDAAGLRSAMISGPNANGMAAFSPGTTSATMKLYLYTNYVPDGDYTYKATAFDVNGAKTVKSVTIHLVH